MLEPKIRKWICNIVGEITPEEEILLKKAQNHFRTTGSEELSGALFNNIHEKKKQRILGITYTPPAIRNELASTVLTRLQQSKRPDESRIVDPCCGSGAFSITLIEKLNGLKVNRLEALANNIYFRDIDKLSVALSMINIFQYMERHGLDATVVKPNAAVINFFDSNDKFDAFITNPPYVKLQNLTIATRETLKSKYPGLFTGALGLSVIFLKKMFDDLEPDGIAGVITQNNFFTSNAGRLFRKEIQKQVYKIDTFGPEPVFAGTTAYTCLIYLTKNQQEEFDFRKINDPGEFRKESSKIKNQSLDSSRWRLGSKDELEKLLKFDTAGIPLNRVCRIRVGIATQFDRGFTVFRNDRKFTGKTPEGQAIEIEPEIVRPLLRVADLTDHESIKRNNRAVVYPYNIVKGKPVIMDEADLEENFPGAYRFLLSWKKELMAREKGRIQESEWYKWGRRQSMIPVRNKLLTKTFNRYPRFYFDESDSLFSNGYALTTVSDAYDLKFVQMVLNSSIFGYYIKLTSFEIDGEYQCYQKNFIERFCLPDIGREQQAELLRHGNIEGFLARYY